MTDILKLAIICVIFLEFQIFKADSVRTDKTMTKYI